MDDEAPASDDPQMIMLRKIRKACRDYELRKIRLAEWCTVVEDAIDEWKTTQEEK
jgi:hypothetical protein